MENKITNILKSLLWLVIVFVGFFYFIFSFLIWSATIFPLFLLLLFSIFLWLILFKKKFQFFIGIFFVFVTYFCVYFLLPSSDCGGGGYWKFGMSSECICLGVKKIGETDLLETDLRCIGKVTGWKNEVK